MSDAAKEAPEEYRSFHERALRQLAAEIDLDFDEVVRGSERMHKRLTDPAFICKVFGLPEPKTP